MAIESIKIENFTVFQDISCDFSPGINIFIGENGIGKTHLLKLIYVANIMHSSGYTLDIRDVFGNSFKTKGCRFIINGDDSYPWTFSLTAHRYEGASLLPVQSYIHVNTDAKTPAVFIPAKEVLSMSNLTRVDDDYKRTLNLDVTITDIIKKAQKMIPDIIPKLAVKLAQKIENQIGGKVFLDENDNTFWIHKNCGAKIPFTSEAEGYKKLGLLWQLVMNKSIKEGTILLWDEPEANLNPKLIPVVVDVLMELSRNGVQVFLATHEYMFAKYFEVKQQETEAIMFHSLYKTDFGAECESNINFRDLKKNDINDAFDVLMDGVIGKNLGD